MKTITANPRRDEMIPSPYNVSALQRYVVRPVQIGVNWTAGATVLVSMVLGSVITLTEPPETVYQLTHQSLGAQVKDLSTSYYEVEEEVDHGEGEWGNRYATITRKVTIDIPTLTEPITDSEWQYYGGGWKSSMTGSDEWTQMKVANAKSTAEGLDYCYRLVEKTHAVVRFNCNGYSIPTTEQKVFFEQKGIDYSDRFIINPN